MSKKVLIIIILLMSCGAQTVPDKDLQIASALSAAPDDMREGATVYGYDSKGNVVLLQKGDGLMVCLADDPTKAGFNAAAYHKDLEPFMARGRALRAEGKSSSEIFDIREEEAKAGTLKMPEKATTLHIRFGKEGYVDKESKDVKNTRTRYVVYIPWATQASTGLPLKPEMPGGPWIMNPGTHRAHIMITPPEVKSE